MPGPLDDIDDIRRYSNALRLQSERRIEALTRRLTAGDIDLAGWQKAMKDELRRANLEQFVVGKGGLRAGLKPGDYGRLGPELRRQYQYLHRFAQDIATAAENGKSLNFAVERAKLYARSTQASMWHSAIPVKLPQVPRDGKTRCRTNCKCRLEYEYERGEEGQVVAVLVTWLLRPAEHCTDCLNLSRAWNPKRFAVTQEAGTIEQAVGLLLLEAGDLDDDQVSQVYAMWEIEEHERWQLH